MSLLDFHMNFNSLSFFKVASSQPVVKCKSRGVGVGDLLFKSDHVLLTESREAVQMCENEGIIYD